MNQEQAQHSDWLVPSTAQNPRPLQPAAGFHCPAPGGGNPGPGESRPEEPAGREALLDHTAAGPADAELLLGAPARGTADRGEQRPSAKPSRGVAEPGRRRGLGGGRSVRERVDHQASERTADSFGEQAEVREANVLLAAPLVRRSGRRGETQRGAKLPGLANSSTARRTAAAGKPGVVELGLSRTQLLEFKRRYGTHLDVELAQHYGLTSAAIQDLAKRFALGKDKAFLRDLPGAQPKPMPRWTKTELEQLRKLYTTEPNLELARQLNRSIKSVVSKAHQLGLKKSEQRLSEMGRQNIALRHQFPEIAGDSPGQSSSWIPRSNQHQPLGKRKTKRQ